MGGIPGLPGRHRFFDIIGEKQGICVFSQGLLHLRLQRRLFMNGRKKLLCLLMLAFFLFTYTSINAFAEAIPAVRHHRSSHETPSSVSGSDNSSSSSVPSKKPVSSKAKPKKKTPHGFVFFSREFHAGLFQFRFVLSGVLSCGNYSP
jgi:hypothetical protein